jgi:predicted N-acetyltransferase YhbS
VGNITGPRPLLETHETERFDCGNEFLNDWLKKFALVNSRSNSAKTFVVCEDNKVIGYYSLAMGSVDYEAATLRIKKGLARHPIPVIVLAKLAVDLDYQKKRIGVSLLKDSFLRSLMISEHIGTRAVFVNAKDDHAKTFYEHHGFQPLPSDTLKLLILVKDIKNAIENPLS